MRPEENPHNAGRCICPSCPTYDDCMGENGDRLFCGRGKTDCDATAAGCICGECPVWAEFALGDYYYCLEGAAPA